MYDRNKDIVHALNTIQQRLILFDKKAPSLRSKAPMIQGLVVPLGIDSLIDFSANFAGKHLHRIGAVMCPVGRCAIQVAEVCTRRVPDP